MDLPEVHAAQVRAMSSQRRCGVLLPARRWDRSDGAPSEVCGEPVVEGGAFCEYHTYTRPPDITLRIDSIEEVGEGTGEVSGEAMVGAMISCQIVEAEPSVIADYLCRLAEWFESLFVRKQEDKHTICNPCGAWLWIRSGKPQPHLCVRREP